MRTFFRLSLMAVALSAGVFASDAPVPAPAPAVAGENVPSFRRDVMPVFFRAGCNSGGCHGSARGKDGFRLSLFGYDPSGDYFRITQQMAGRRINLSVPEESLILMKSTGKVPHTGGESLLHRDECNDRHNGQRDRHSCLANSWTTSPDDTQRDP